MRIRNKWSGEIYTLVAADVKLVNKLREANFQGRCPWHALNSGPIRKPNQRTGAFTDKGTLANGVKGDWGEPAWACPFLFAKSYFRAGLKLVNPVYWLQDGFFEPFSSQCHQSNNERRTVCFGA